MIEYGMFMEIRDAVAELHTEAVRVAGISDVQTTIETGELEKILHNARHSVKLLRRIQGPAFVEPPGASYIRCDGFPSML